MNWTSYTTLAHRYTARFPMLTYIGIQINFWIIANLLLICILHLQTRILAVVYSIERSINVGSLLLVAISCGLIYGGIFGTIGFQLEQRNSRRWPIGKTIIIKTVVSIALLITFLMSIRFYMPDLLKPIPTDQEDKAWLNVFYLLLLYYFFMALLISYINQVNKKYGPGVLIPLLLGSYRHPREEERIFLFMDLKSSTATAETLGHIKYSAFIRDCFEDINEVLLPFRAQVYQYVGDEIVLTWPEKEGLTDNRCIYFFFACQQRLQERISHYLSNYGLTPSFKAGLHTGKVTAIEIGQVKMDIAYHGDTVNTAARIQSVCNQYQSEFLVSQLLLDKIQDDHGFLAEPLGQVALRGKSDPIELVDLQQIHKTSFGQF